MGSAGWCVVVVGPSYQLGVSKLLQLCLLIGMLMTPGVGCEWDCPAVPLARSVDLDQTRRTAPHPML